MKLRHIIYFVVSIVLMVGITNAQYSYAAKKSKAKTSQSSGSKKSKNTGKKSKGKKSSSKESSAKDSGKKSRKKSGRNKDDNSRSHRKNSRKSSSRYSGNYSRNSYKAPEKEVALNDSLTLAVNKSVLEWMPKNLNPGGLRVNSVKPDSKKRITNVGLNENFTYLPVTSTFIDSLQRAVRDAMPDSLQAYRVNLNVGKRPLSYYVRRIDKLPEKYRHNPGFVEEVHPLFTATKGMDNDIIALWHSHGRYFKNGGWAWQRPFLFETAEDVYTMGYILPYVVPMLENAGAYVMLPRERDTSRHEVIVDNDTNDGGQLFSQPHYKEMSGKNKWSTGEEEGFIYDLPDFRDTENPFENGTYRQALTQRGGQPSVAAWYADIPEDGKYAVYVSYKTLPGSTADARYTVNYSGGSKEFKVNQQMGGGTWIYLGTFPFEGGFSDTEPVVTLTNLTEGQAGSIVTADAIKIGGGMGNIARSSRRSDIYYDPSTPIDDEEIDEDEDGDDEIIEIAEDEDAEEDIDESDGEDGGDGVKAPEPAPAPKNEKKGPAPKFTTSGLPRYLEGARYWMHWAGIPEYVYSPFHGSNDYKDDYTSRGHWVNYLAGGSRVLPGKDGLGIPVDLAFALHTDAGKRSDDSTVGTLGIYSTQGGGSYADGTPRMNSRMLTDVIMQQITGDIRREFEPRWTRRSMWDKSYLEARVPEVPTTLIELLSHQNYGDMVYGLDPNFRFTVGRAIYKGMARFLAERKDRKLVIQPLAVQDFAIRRTKASHYRLSWAPTPDPSEPTAMPDNYVIMERSGSDLGFHKIGETHSTHFDLRVADHDVHSYYIVAVNAGGASFPSETLALREGTTTAAPALIVNDFTRVAGPAHYTSGGNAGFKSEEDFGVPYIRDISFTGHQSEFRRSAGEGFGRSGSNYIAQVIAGNTFDFAAVHGAALAGSGLGFVSASVAAVEKGEVKLTDYTLVDLIVGKQKTTTVGSGKSGVHYRAFPASLQKLLRAYVEKGGNLIVSGQYIISDLNDNLATDADRAFAREILGSEPGEPDTRKSGRLRDVYSGKELSYSSTLNEKHYIVERPDILRPAEGAATVEFLTFGGSGARAGHIVERGRGKVAVMTVPLEALTDANQRTLLIKELLTGFKQ